MSNAVERYLRFLFEPDPFRGKYSLNGFDLLFLIPYFAILITLSFYGLHRFRLIYLYKKYRRNRPVEPPPPAEWPQVTIQLPLYNEKYVVERLLDAVVRLDYPRERLEIQVLDDSTDETVAVARAAVARYAAQGVRIRHFHRSHRSGYKAGALAQGLAQARGSSSPSSTPTSSPPRTSCAARCPTFPIPGWGWCRHAGLTSTATTRCSPACRRFCSTPTSCSNTAAAAALVSSSTSMVLRGCGAGRRSKTPAAGEHDTLTEDTEPQLPRAVVRLAVPLSARGGGAFRAAGGYKRLQDAASALGQGV